MGTGAAGALSCPRAGAVRALRFCFGIRPPMHREAGDQGIRCILYAPTLVRCRRGAHPAAFLPSWCRRMAGLQRGRREHLGCQETPPCESNKARDDCVRRRGTADKGCRQPCHQHGFALGRPTHDRGRHRLLFLQHLSRRMEPFAKEGRPDLSLSASHGQHLSRRNPRRHSLAAAADAADRQPRPLLSAGLPIGSLLS